VTPGSDIVLLVATGFVRRLTASYRPRSRSAPPASCWPAACGEQLVLNPFVAADAEFHAGLINERGLGARGFGTTVQWG